MRLIKRFNLRPDEHIVAVIRRSVLAYVAPTALAFLSVFLAFFLIVPLFARRTFGVAVFVLLLAIGAIMAFRALWFWYWTAFVVTDARIIDSDQRGVFHRRISDIPFEKVEDLTIEVRGIVPTVFHLGTIRVQTAGAQSLVELRMVPQPEVVHELLGRLQRGARGRTTSTVSSEPDLAQLSPDALTRLRERIDVELQRKRGAMEDEKGV